MITLWDPYHPKLSTRHTTLSGVEVNQNQLGTAAPLAVPTVKYYTFFLPSNYRRGTTHIPDLTGLQVCFEVEDAETFTANVTLEVKEFGDWVTPPQEPLARGSVLKSHAAGDAVWVDVYFNAPIPVVEERLEREFRIGVQSDSKVWATAGTGNELDALLFRVLSGSADSGEDFLGNSYRSILSPSPVGAVSTASSGDSNRYWLSKPNPSRFAVESLYFDIRNNVDKPAVVDRIFADPITPGIFFTLYYTNDGDPATTDAEWEQKLWNPAYQTFRLERRTEFPLREPISAKYLKVEFTHLQPQFYQAGTFHQPIRYQKHPKWVLDYFTARMTTQENTDDVMVSSKVKVVSSALKLAYAYVSDDLGDPEVPVTAAQVDAFLADQGDVSNQVDSNTLARINTEMKPYTLLPGGRSTTGQGLLAAFVADTLDRTYPVERIRRQQARITEVSSLDRLALVIENEMPVMFFFVTARHTYRQLEASFEEDRAYFAGVRELAFVRDHYTVAADTATYVDNLSDFSNVVRNDFLELEHEVGGAGEPGVGPFEPNLPTSGIFLRETLRP